MKHAIYLDNPGGIDIAGPGPCPSVWDGDGGQTTVVRAEGR